MNTGFGARLHLSNPTGQTGSGKTFTMLGPNKLKDFSDELRGVIPHSIEHLFLLISREVEKIYNEQIFDLLHSASARRPLREDKKKRVFVQGAVENYAASAAGA